MNCHVVVINRRQDCLETCTHQNFIAPLCTHCWNSSNYLAHTPYITVMTFNRWHGVILSLSIKFQINFYLLYHLFHSTVTPFKSVRNFINMPTRTAYLQYTLHTNIECLPNLFNLFVEFHFNKMTCNQNFTRNLWKQKLSITNKPQVCQNEERKFLTSFT